MKKRENKRKISKSSRSKRKSSNYKSKLEFQSVNPLYTYLVCIMCLRSWKKFIDKSKEKTLNMLRNKEKMNPTFKDLKKEKSNQNIITPSPQLDKTNFFESSALELYMHSYAPNYIPENE